MGLNFPKWEELSKDEQVPIVNLPIQGNYVIVGGPGTGKTILAIYRAAIWRKEQSDNKKVLFLVYNKTLMQYISDSLNVVELPSSYSKTWHSWLFRLYFRICKEEIPQLRPFVYDWEVVKEKLMVDHLKSSIDYLILDEAQDFPPELLQILNHLCKNASIFGDSQQALEQTSTTSDFSHAFSAERKVYYLNQNYRNTKEIADVAQLFYAGDPSDIPARPKRTGDKPKLVQCKSIVEMAKIIANYHSNHPSQFIGVLTPDYTTVIPFQQELKKLGFTSQIYVRGETIGKNHFSFDESGIKIMSYNTMKGLEFDAVFLPFIDSALFNNQTDSLLKKVYVACTRAKYSLSFLYSNESSSFVISRLSSSSHLLDQVFTSENLTLKL